MAAGLLRRPRLSVVTVVHREQVYVEQFADALLEQDFDDWELVAVDDGAVGHGGALLGELAARDGRLRVVRLPEHAGLGPARAAGVRAAGGEHVWWVPVTDLLPPSALRRVAERLDGVDVLVVDYEREDRLRDRSPRPHHGLVASLAGEAFVGAARNRPEIIATGDTTFDKVVRRDLLVDAVAGGQSDVAVGPAFALPALLAAERIAALAPSVLTHRVVPQAASDEVDPLGVVAGYAAALRTRRRGDAVHAALLAAAVEHVLELLDASSAPDRDRAREALGDLLRVHGVPAVRGGSAGGPPLSGLSLGAAARLDAARLRLLARRAHRALDVVEVVAGVPAVVGERVRRASPAARRARRAAPRADELRYAAARRKPLDLDLAVFASYWYGRYSDNPRAIYEKACELVPHLRGVWVTRAEHAGSFPPDVERVIAGTPAYYDLLARACTFVNNVNFPSHLVKRPGTVHVMTHHGTPLKRMGLDLRHNELASFMDWPALLRRCDRWDYCVSSNRMSTLYWQRAFPADFEMLETGYPRNDELALATDERRADARARLGIEPGQTAVLYAPTYRDWDKSYLSLPDLGAFADALGSDHVVLSRSHYFCAPASQRACGRVIDVADHPSINELCIASDVLVTDYSSVMFDYAVLDRPIVIHAPDWELYSTRRGTTFDLMAGPPGAVTSTEDELVDAIRSGAAAGEEADRLRQAFRARFCPHEDGGASERVVRAVWLGERVPVRPPGLAAVA